MYYPIQIPYILNKDFSRNMDYLEEAVEQFGDFIICFWEMQPRSNHHMSVSNIIVADGCIDLVAGYDEKQIGFAGMSKTDFHFTVDLPSRFIGARLKPGAFFQLTGISATEVMDSFLPIEAVCKNFDRNVFFSLPFEQAKQYVKDFFKKLICEKEPDQFTTLFDTLAQRTPSTTAELYQMLHFSPRQCQRLFDKQYGISPKMVLSIVRFQKCLEILTSGKGAPAEILSMAEYYDQSHFIKDFKKNIGITPLELIRTYQS